MYCPGVYQNFHRHSALLFKIGTKNVRYMQMEEGGIRIKYARQEEFEAEFHLLENYPLKRAVTHFASFSQLHGITDGAAEVLCSLFNGTMENDMDEKTQETLDKAASMKEGKALATKKKAAAPVPAKKEAKAAPAKKETKAAPAKKTAAPAPSGRGRKAEWKEKEHKVGDASAVGRGAIKTFVDYAAKLKKFTLADMLKKFRNMKDFSEERVLRYFTWCRAKEIFIEGK